MEPWRLASTRVIAGWPKLGWVAVVEPNDQRYRLLTGEHVEVTDDWLIEGIWDGDFGAGSFDRTAQVFGSGVRSRGNTLMFVPPGTTTERLWYAGPPAGQMYVSNSLPLLLAASSYRLLEDVPDYPARSAAMSADPDDDVAIPAKPYPIGVLYHHNLTITNTGRMQRARKPSTVPAFTSFEEYRDFLYATGRALAKNATDPRRRHAMDLLTTVSSGYDSPAAAVFARAMGCRKAVTILAARSTVPRSDSGVQVARQLALSCTSFPRGGRGGEHELAFWAAIGHPQEEHFAVLDFPGPVCLLFTGHYGGGVWSIRRESFHSPFQRPDWSGLGFGEYRLVASVIHCPIPFLGATRYDDLWEISRSEAMHPWMRYGNYDRPIPRRLVEEAGVNGDSFGTKKSATSYDDSFVWPTRGELAADYRRFLIERGISPPPVRLARFINLLYQRILFPIQQRMNRQAQPRRLWPRTQRLLFVWANRRLAELYARSLSDAGELQSQWVRTSTPDPASRP